MKTNHTPEPWAIDAELTPNSRSVIVRTTGGEAISGNTHGPHKESHDYNNAARIVSCVNGCKGITDPEKTVPELVELLTLALPYIEEGEQFNAPHKKTLSKKVKSILSKVQEVQS